MAVKVKFNTRTLHQNREEMRHPKASGGIEGQPSALGSSYVVEWRLKGL